jgi:serine/threonine protein kinase
VEVRGLCIACLWATAPPPLEIPGVTLEHELGRGGTGTVYAARTAQGTRVAIKVFDRDGDDLGARARFDREASLLRELSHPNILALVERGEASGHRYLVTELALGGAIADRIPVAPEIAVEVAIQVCDALAFAHERGVVHRDIKPQNVLVAADGSIRLADFGTARQLDAEHMRITVTGQTAGTPYFVAPEAMHGAPDDPRMDVYGVGVLLYHMITGALPVGYFAPLPGELDAICRRALAPAEERYPTIVALRGDLIRARQAKPRRRRMMRVALPAIAIAALAALVVAGRAPSPSVSGVATGTALPTRDRVLTPAPAEILPPSAPVRATAPATSAQSVSATAPAARPIPPARRALPGRDEAAPPRSGTADLASDPAVAASKERATLTVIARPWAEVTIDGVPRGRAEPPVSTFVVTPGVHEVVLTHPTTQQRMKERIRVTADGATIRADLGNGP